jgi:hypothetical protein
MVGLTILVSISGRSSIPIWTAVFSLKIPAQDLLASFTPGEMDPANARVLVHHQCIPGDHSGCRFLSSSGKNFGHYLQVILPGLVVAMVYLLYFLRLSIQQDRSSRSLQIAVLAAILIVSIGGGLEIAAKELPSLNELKAFFSTPDLTVYRPTELEQYIIDHSSPDDYVLIWAGHPSMNFVTQRRSPTKYIFLLHLFAPTPSGSNGFNEFLSDLQADPPELVVVQPDCPWGYPILSECSSLPRLRPVDTSGYAGFTQYIDTNYDLKYSIWDWEVCCATNRPAKARRYRQWTT